MVCLQIYNSKEYMKITIFLVICIAVILQITSMKQERLLTAIEKAGNNNFLIAQQEKDGMAQMISKRRLQQAKVNKNQRQPATIIKSLQQLLEIEHKDINKSKSQYQNEDILSIKIISQLNDINFQEYWDNFIDNYENNIEIQNNGKEKGVPVQKQAGEDQEQKIIQQNTEKVQEKTLQKNILDKQKAGEVQKQKTIQEKPEKASQKIQQQESQSNLPSLNNSNHSIPQKNTNLSSQIDKKSNQVIIIIFIAIFSIALISLIIIGVICVKKVRKQKGTDVFKGIQLTNDDQISGR